MILLPGSGPGRRKKVMIRIDGSFGEGGGQILRTSLSLSAVTGKPFRIEKIRAGRERPGLLRQHLTALLAAAEVCGADVQGASLGSTELTFLQAKFAQANTNSAWARPEVER
jgi:RNA 3'-terminal phosphate cyclase (ATP)